MQAEQAAQIEARESQNSHNHNVAKMSRKKCVIDIGKWKPDEKDLNTFLCPF